METPTNVTSFYAKPENKALVTMLESCRVAFCTLNKPKLPDLEGILQPIITTYYTHFHMFLDVC